MMVFIGVVSKKKKVLALFCLYHLAIQTLTKYMPCRLRKRLNQIGSRVTIKSVRSIRYRIGKKDNEK